MLEIVDFEPWHLDNIEPLERNGRAKTAKLRHILPEFASFTMMKNGGPVASGGLIPVHSDRLIAWSVVSCEMPLLPAVRLARNFLDKQDALRIETPVDCGDEACERWVRFLGFRPEGPPMKYFNADGSSATLFVRFNDGNRP